MRNVKKLNDIKVLINYKQNLLLWKIWFIMWTSLEHARQNIKTSADDSVGYYEAGLNYTRMDVYAYICI
jgi:hypothetical protein